MQVGFKRDLQDSITIGDVVERGGGCREKRGLHQLGMRWGDGMVNSNR